MKTVLAQVLIILTSTFFVAATSQARTSGHQAFGGKTNKAEKKQDLKKKHSLQVTEKGRTYEIFPKSKFIEESSKRSSFDKHNQTQLPKDKAPLNKTPLKRVPKNNPK